jgi:hypothetical protein
LLGHLSAGDRFWLGTINGERKKQDLAVI